jgi:hypothetical protein
MKRLSVIAGILAAAVVAAALITPSDAPAFAPGDWRTFVVCRTAKVAAVDPIVSPNIVPSAHVHTFAGNTRTSEKPGYKRMTALPLASSCELTRDTAAYWAPALRDKQTGTLLAPRQWNVYYVNPWKASGMVPFPPNFKAVSDKWEYHSDGVRIWFDRVCWDGTLNMPSPAEYRAHTRERGSGCPSGFGTLLPKMHYNLHFGVDVRLDRYEPASAPMMGWHGDIWNTWHQPSFAAIVKACLNPPATVNGQGCGSLDDGNVASKLRARGVPLPPITSPTPTPTPSPTPDPAVENIVNLYNALSPEQQAAFRQRVGI